MNINRVQGNAAPKLEEFRGSRDDLMSGYSLPVL